jgi:hypothetical protein
MTALSIIFAVILTVLGPLPQGVLVDGKCDICIWLHQESTVIVGATTSTLAGVSRWHDEKGVSHYYDPNVMYTAYVCSRGHHLVSRTLGGNEIKWDIK